MSSHEQDYPKLWQTVRDGESSLRRTANDADKLMHTHTTVQKILDLFDGQILSTEETTEDYAALLHERKLDRALRYSELVALFTAKTATRLSDTADYNDRARAINDAADTVQRLLGYWMDNDNEHEIYPL